jgi:TolB-like protein/DNA-binding winged helix-turn-helix (wHTH) protein/Flp pilus assembly protein TadD
MAWLNPALSAIRQMLARKTPQKSFQNLEEVLTKPLQHAGKGPITKHAKHFYEFGQFRIDTLERRLLRDGKVAPLTPKAYETLLLLVENWGHALEKEEMLKKLWPDTFVEEVSLARNISVLRKVLGEEVAAGEPRYIETIPKRGYRFVAEVREISDEAGDGAGRARFKLRLAATAIACALLAAGVVWAWLSRRSGHPVSPGRITSLAVLPFKNIGADARYDYLADGITDELITKLTKLKGIRVIARSVAMRFKSSSQDAAEIGRQLGVDAVLEGTIRTAGSRFRVNVHLVNSRQGFEIWADDTFENDLRKLLASERQLAEAVAGKIKGQLTTEERALVAQHGTANVDAYELLLRGKSHFSRSNANLLKQDTAQQRELARAMFESAIRLDPNFAEAYGWLALTLYHEFFDLNDTRATLDAAVANANKGLALDPNLIIARRALIYIYQSTGPAEAGLRQAKYVLQTNPEDLDALEAAGVAYSRAGLKDRAIPLFQKVLRADPSSISARDELARCYWRLGKYHEGLEVLAPLLVRDPCGLWVAMQLYLDLGRFGDAIQMGNRCQDKYPMNPAIWCDWGAALQAAGQQDRAREVWLEGARRFAAQLAGIDNSRTRIWLGLLYARLGQREPALAEVRTVLNSHPDDPWTFNRISQIFALLGNHREALAYLDHSIERGWLGIFHPDHMRRPFFEWYRLRDDPGFRAARDEVARRVELLKAQY